MDTPYAENIGEFVDGSGWFDSDAYARYLAEGGKPLLDDAQ